MEHFEKAQIESSEKPKPFKLCFPSGKTLLGQSGINSRNKTVALKFYDRQNENINEDLVKKYYELLNKPLNKKSSIRTENEVYGLYHYVQLTDADRRDKRLFAHKRTDVIVREHLMNYAKIRNY